MLILRRHEFTGMARIEELPEHLKVGALFNGAEGVGGLTTMLAVSPSLQCHNGLPGFNFCVSPCALAGDVVWLVSAVASMLPSWPQYGRGLISGLNK